MSLILEALNKADQDRKVRDEAPSITPNHVPLTDNSIKVKFVIITAACLIGLLVLLLVFVLLRNTSPTKPITAATLVAASQTVAAPEMIAATQLDAASRDEHLIALKGVESEGVISTQNKPSPLSEDEALTVSPDSLNATRQHYIQELYTSTTGSTSELAPETQALYDELKEKQTAKKQKRKQVPVPVQVQEHPSVQNTYSAAQTRDVTVVDTKPSEFELTNTVKQLPMSVQNKISSLLYSQHNFQDQGHSSVVINGLSLSKNSRLSNGITVSEITEDGVILQLEGYKFRLYALNSWVNFN
ncbi:MAG: general secretion pathway protein B [Flavobacteriales bacterium]|jgi:general secretion pathway protein B